MDKYIEAEMLLAKLLGWRCVVRYTDTSGYYLTGCADHVNNLVLPRWTRDWSACGPLMAEHELDIDWAVDSNAVRACINTKDMYFCHHEDIAIHDSKEAAVRFAIVQAVISKLGTA